MESHFRTIIKSVTWRAIALIITTTIALIVTGQWELAASIGIADTIIKLFAYYGHERIWLKVNLGKLKSPDYEI